MYLKAIKYKGLWLAPGSVAHQLHQDGKLKELDQHIRTVEAKGMGKSELTIMQESQLCVTKRR